MTVHWNSTLEWKCALELSLWPLVVQRALTGARGNPATVDGTAVNSDIDNLFLLFVQI